jgi:G:T-mismatch repair DNA endonuclease (very short patch repair protein)
MPALQFPVRWRPLKFNRADYFKMPKKRHGPLYRKGTRATYRPIIGENPQEKRAVPISEVYGSLPERIVYKELVRRGIPFSFQSSSQGGRQQFGGIVVDFILLDRQTIIEVDGLTWHTGIVADVRDARRDAILKTKGYEVLILWDWQILNVDLFNDWCMRNLSNFTLFKETT